jgi:hypothetical protein
MSGSATIAIETNFFEPGFLRVVQTRSEIAMSTSFTPSRDLILSAKIPAVPSLFTTFATGHFVKPGKFSQPVKAAVKPETAAGFFTEIFAAAPIDLDYDEPNAVVEAELELVTPTGAVHQMELQVVSGSVTKEKALDRVIQADQRSAA